MKRLVLLILLLLSFKVHSLTLGLKEIPAGDNFQYYYLIQGLYYQSQFFDKIDYRWEPELGGYGIVYGCTPGRCIVLYYVPLVEGLPSELTSIVLYTGNGMFIAQNIIWKLNSLVHKYEKIW